MRKSKRFPAFASLFLCAAMLLTLTASAANYTTYTSIKPQITAPYSCTGMQGFDVGSTYTYSIKVNTDDGYTKAVIYRTKISDGTTTKMTNGTIDYITGLDHANDLVLTSNVVNGKTHYYMFVVTTLTGSMSLVKLEYEGTTYHKVGNYTIKYNNANQAMSGVKIISKDASNIYFLFKNVRTYYRGQLGLTDTSGEINVSLGFTLNVNPVVIGGVTYDLTSYSNQGFEYYNNSVYHPLTSADKSVILVYRNISSATGGVTLYYDPNLTFRIDSADYSKFEIEGCGHDSAGRLLFNTNRVRASDGVAFDGVHYMNGYTG